MRKSNFVFILFLLFVLSACTPSTKQEDPYIAVKDASFKTIGVAGATYSGIMQSVANAYESGLINDANKAKIDASALVFFGVYQSSVDALALYVAALETKDNSTIVNKQKLLSDSITKLLTSKETFVTYYYDITNGLKDFKQWEEPK